MFLMQSPILTPMSNFGLISFEDKEFNADKHVREDHGFNAWNRGNELVVILLNIRYNLASIFKIEYENVVWYKSEN